MGEVGGADRQGDFVGVETRMQMTVLGCQAGMPSRGEPSSGYPVRTESDPLLARWAGLFPMPILPLPEKAFEREFEVREYAPGEEFTVGDCRVRLLALRHAAPNCGVRVESEFATLAYIGNTGMTDAVVDLGYRSPPRRGEPGGSRCRPTRSPQRRGRRSHRRFRARGGARGHAFGLDRPRVDPRQARPGAAILCGMGADGITGRAVHHSSIGPSVLHCGLAR
jgi:hypothetical protein